MGRVQCTIASIVVFWFLSVSAASAQTSYSLIDLGTLGGNTSNAYAINLSRQVTGVADTTGNQSHAFLYSGGVMSDLGTLGGIESYGQGINNFGQVVGESTITNGQYRAFSDNGSMLNLGTLGGNLSNALGISDTGQITGYSYTSGGSTHAFLYSNSVMTDLGTIPGGLSSIGRGINVLGQVTGDSAINGNDRAFLYSNSTMRDLGTLGGHSSIGLAINISAQVTGQAQISQGFYHAFLNTNGVMRDLGTLGGSTSIGYALNNSGQVTGEAYTPSNTFHAFIYSNGSTRDLNTLKDASGTGWTLTVGYGINDSGQIVGTGINPQGKSHAFLLTPNTLLPAPPSPGPRPTYPTLPNQTPNTKGLVLVVHGMDSNPAAWANSEVTDIENQLSALGTSKQWDVEAYDWSQWAGTGLNPGLAASNAIQIGQQVGTQIRAMGYTEVHFIGHSAGSWLINQATTALVGSSIQVQDTFLDSYVGPKSNPADLGKDATFAEQYVDNRLFWPYTNATLPNAYNVDVTNLDQDQSTNQHDHSWPYLWYMQTTANPTDRIAQNLGFPTSPEYSGTIASFSDFPKGARVTLSGSPNPPDTAATSSPNISLAAIPHTTSSTGTVTFVK